MFWLLQLPQKKSLLLYRCRWGESQLSLEDAIEVGLAAGTRKSA